MLPIIALVVLASLCEAKPMLNADAPRPSFGTLGIDNFIVNGQDASPGEWPWQLSQQRASGSAWSHSCGASLLSSNKALSASHCVDGALPSNLRVIAGLHQRTDESGTQTSNVASYTMHENYQGDVYTYSNDISILNLATAITTSSTIQFLTLPPDNNDNFLGDICTITGWGRTSSSNILPDILQEAQIEVIGTAECDTLMQGVVGVRVWDNHLCLYDRQNNIGSCNGDSGGPCNCPNGAGGFYVAGVTSWGISSGSGNCLQTYPSVYTRTSAYLAWIAAN
jgi:secreted trypsin-like serine protease